LESDGGGVGLRLARDDLDAEALTPDRQLLYGGRAERVAGCEDHAGAGVPELFRELRDRGRLPCAIDSGNQDHGGGMVGPREPDVPSLEHFFQAPFEESAHLFGLRDLFGLPGGFHSVGAVQQGIHGLGAKIGGEEVGFDLVEERLVERPPEHEQALQPLPRLGQGVSEQGPAWLLGFGRPAIVQGDLARALRKLILRGPSGVRRGRIARQR
jgi:hypothetical protein